MVHFSRFWTLLDTFGHFWTNRVKSSHFRSFWVAFLECPETHFTFALINIKKQER
jgi:membrane-associated protease RseP (regulator of RpoE activity)